MTVPTSTNPLSLDADETMRQAVDRFRTRMTAANWQFIQDRIREIDARGLATEKEKICMMQTWRNFEELDRDNMSAHSDPNAHYKSNQFRQTRELAAVPALLAEDTRPLFALDGLYPPRLCTAEARRLFLEAANKRS